MSQIHKRFSDEQIRVLFQGYCQGQFSRSNLQELLALIEDYRLGLVPLIVPLTLLKHHLNRYPVPEWVHQQVYLHPYPKELMLRNHV